MDHLIGLEHVCKLKRDRGLRLDRSFLRKRALLGSGCGDFS